MASTRIDNKIVDMLTDKIGLLWVHVVQWSLQNYNIHSCHWVHNTPYLSSKDTSCSTPSRWSLLQNINKLITLIDVIFDHFHYSPFVKRAISKDIFIFRQVLNKIWIYNMGMIFHASPFYVMIRHYYDIIIPTKKSVLWCTNAENRMTVIANILVSYISYLRHCSSFEHSTCTDDWQIRIRV